MAIDTLKFRILRPKKSNQFCRYPLVFGAFHGPFLSPLHPLIGKGLYDIWDTVFESNGVQRAYGFEEDNQEYVWLPDFPSSSMPWMAAAAWDAEVWEFARLGEKEDMDPIVKGFNIWLHTKGETADSFTFQHVLYHLCA